MTNIRLPNDINITLDAYDLMYLDELSEPARKAGVKEKVNPKMVFDFVKSQLTLIEIEKLHISLYNDKGVPLVFNGAEWYMSIISEHLYKY